MNNEVNNNSNNELNVKSNNNSKLIIVILVVLLIGALGFICYDKFINKEKPPVSAPTPTPTPTPVATPTEVKNSSDGKVVLTTENQIINIGDKSFNVRIEKMKDSDVAGSLYINDAAIVGKDDNNVISAYAYVTNDFVLFVGYGQSFNVQSEMYQEYIAYAIDSNGSSINLSNYVYQLRNVHIDNGEIVATGVNSFDALEDKATPTELVIKYENNTITVIPKM